MTRWQVCHQSGRVLFTTDNEVTARNREQFGWKVIEVDKSREQFEQIAAKMLAMSPETIKSDRRGDKYNHKPLMQWWQFWQASRDALDIELSPACWRTYYPDTDEYQSRVHSESGPESCARRIASEIGGYVVPAYYGNPQPSLTPANDIANGTDTE